MRASVVTVVAAVLIAVCAAQSRVIYVDDDAGAGGDGASWATAYKYLQDGLADANSAGEPVEIRVAQGLYRPDRSAAEPNGTGSRLASFALVSGVALRGGYAGLGGSDPNARDVDKYVTVLSGDLAGDDADKELEDVGDLVYEPTRAENCVHIVTVGDVDGSSVMEGLSF